MSKEFVINIKKFNEFLNEYFTDEARRSITYRFISSGAIEPKEMVTKEQLEQAKKDIAKERFCEDDGLLTEVYLCDVFDVLDKLIEEDNNG